MNTVKVAEILKRLTISKVTNVMVEIEVGKASEMVEKMAETNIKTTAKLILEIANLQLY
jgi:hypothetical protein